MKSKSVFKFFAVFCLMAMATMALIGQNKNRESISRVAAPTALMVENFDYPAATALSTVGWTAHSAGGTNPITVTSPGLTLAGYPGTGVGNAASLATTGEDLNRTFPSVSSGSVYAAFLVNVSEASTDPAGGYFFHLGPSPVGTTFRGRVFAKKDASNNLAFGISKATTAAADIVFTGFTYSLNTTYLIVVKYTIVDGATNDTVAMYVGTTFPGTEPAATVSATDIATQSDVVPGTVSLRQGATATAPTVRVDGIRVATSWAEISTAPPGANVDFNGDGKTDFAVQRQDGNQRNWLIGINGGPIGFYGVPWGLSSDNSVPGDYDGDNKTDIAVFRGVTTGQPSGNGFFYILNSSNSTFTISDFGQLGDDPRVVGDYDGDGKTDVAVYRAGAPGFWFFRGTLNNPSGAITYMPWGIANDRPAPGDYDGDGKNDFVVARNEGANLNFWMFQTTAGISLQIFGLPTDQIWPGDFDGDGKTDISIVRTASSLQWWHRKSSDGNAVQTVFGLSGDVPTPGDYDGDGKTDQAIFRSGTFWFNGSASGVGVFPFGAPSGDYPIAGLYGF